MARIPGVPARKAGLMGRLAYRFGVAQYGQVPEPMTVWRHHRRIFWTWAMWELGNQRALHVLDPALRDLATLRVAMRLGCSWCVDFGSMLVLRTGMSPERIAGLDEFTTSSLYTDDERAALAYADAMVDTPQTVTDEQVADLVGRFGEDGLVELTYVVAVEQLRSRFNAALGITAQGFSTACAVPSPGSAPRTARSAVRP
jgi:AhpD family alkylhydroperoxidase